MAQERTKDYTWEEFRARLQKRAEEDHANRAQVSLQDVSELCVSAAGNSACGACGVTCAGGRGCSCPYDG